MSQLDVDETRLILLIGDLMNARRSGDQPSARRFTQQLQDFSEQTAFPNVAAKAAATIAAASIQDMENGLRSMADIAEELSPLRQTLTAATELAEQGKASLFFPRVASTLVQVEGLLNSAVAAADTLKNDIAAVSKDFDVEKLKSLVEKIKTTGEDLSRRLEGLKA
jgi:hypothetical protein